MALVVSHRVSLLPFNRKHKLSNAKLSSLGDIIVTAAHFFFRAGKSTKNVCNVFALFGFLKHSIEEYGSEWISKEWWKSHCIAFLIHRVGMINSWLIKLFEESIEFLIRKEYIFHILEENIYSLFWKKIYSWF